MTISTKGILIKFFCLQLAFFTISTGLLAQKKSLEKKLTLSVREERLEDILDKISEETRVYFSYNSDLIGKNQRFTLKSENAPLYQFLDKLLVGTSLHYKQVKKQVIIFKKVKDQLNPKEEIQLFGTVRDGVSKEPISGVNVFISGSLKGSSTDKFGNFAIDDLYPDVYEVVFSHVAYDIRLMTVNAKHAKPTSFNVILIPKTIKLKEVEVNAEKEKNWNRHYYLFESEFLGNTINAAKCRITNSEVISFDYNKETEVLTATADQPLLINNNALGYEIQYFLQSFESNNAKSTIHGVLSYREKIAPSRKIKRQWKKNRKKSYYGSYSHFLKSAYNNKLKKEGFKVYLVDTIGQQQTIEVSENDILYDKKKNVDIKLRFNGYLKVDFVKSELLTANEIIKEYYRTGNAVQNGVQTSYIKLNVPYATIMKNGFLKEQFAVTKYGYWSWERVAEYMPFEYKP